VPIKLAADSLTAVMLLVVTSVSFLVHWYSMGYMHGDGGYPRFYSYLSLFTFSMLMLVLSANLLLLYVFWEAVGLCSYLLIGFWFHKKSAAEPGRRPSSSTASATSASPRDPAPLREHAERGLQRGLRPRAGDPPETVTLICLLLFVGACGKSAQLPLHVWLPTRWRGRRRSRPSSTPRRW